VAFNYWTRDFVIVKEGEELCPECNGYGIEVGSILNIKDHKKICFKCSGHGKVDWIEKAVGIKDLAIGAIEF